MNITWPNTTSLIRQKNINLSARNTTTNAWNHQYVQEAKDAKIHLHEAEMRVYDALAHVHAEEVTALCLKIEYLHLTNTQGP